MAVGSKPAMYAKIDIRRTRFREFQRDLDVASVKALNEAGAEGAKEARRRFAPHAYNYSGRTARRIGYKVLPGKKLILYVGTLQGVMIEYGWKARRNRGGAYQGDPFLRPGMEVAATRIKPSLKRRLRKKWR